MKSLTLEIAVKEVDSFNLLILWCKVYGLEIVVVLKCSVVGGGGVEGNLGCFCGPPFHQRNYRGPSGPIRFYFPAVT